MLDDNLISWQESHLQSLGAALNEAQAIEAVVAAARELDFEYCAYGMRLPLPVTRPAISMLNNYSASWQKRYVEKNYLASDPTVAHGLVSLSPLVWSDEVFAAAPSLWDDARDHGLRVGMAQSAYDAKGGAGLLTVARSHHPLSPAELRRNSVRVWWLSQATHETMSRLALQRRLPEPAICLTTREMEVLRWTADGKTSSEVGEIIHISERTVNFHINNSLLKLGAANKTAGVIKAALLRLL